MTLVQPKPGEPYGLWINGVSRLRDTAIHAGQQSGVIDSEKSGQLTYLDWSDVQVVTISHETHWLMRLRNVVGHMHNVKLLAAHKPVVEHGCYVNLGGTLIVTQLHVVDVGGQAWQSCYRPDETHRDCPQGLLALIALSYQNVGNQPSGVGGGASFAVSCFATGQRIHIEHLIGNVKLTPWMDWAKKSYASRGALFVGAEYPYTNGRKPWFLHEEVNGKWYATQYTTPALYVGHSVIRHSMPDRAIARLEGIGHLVLDNVDFGDEGFIEIDRPDLGNDPRADMNCGKVEIRNCKGRARLRYRGEDVGAIGEVVM